MGTDRNPSRPPTPREVQARSGFAPRDAAQIKMQVANTLGPFDAMHLLALLADISSISVPSDFPLPILPHVIVEYVASVLLERDRSVGSRPDAPAHEVRQAAQGVLPDIERMMSLTLGARMIESGHADDPVKQLTADLAFWDLTFRWPSYPNQERQALTELFSTPEIEQALRDAVGFTAQDALDLYSSMDQLIAGKRDALRAMHNRLIDDAANRDPRLAEMPADQRRLLSAAMQMGPDLVDVWTVSETQLSTFTGRRWQLCQAFLQSLSCRFGDTKGTNLASGRSLVRSRPLVRDEQDRYLPTSLDNVLRALRPTLEAALPGPVFDTNYQPRRAQWVEDRTVKAIRQALPGAQDLAEPPVRLDGVLNYEVDVLVRIDMLCLVIEAKGGRLHFSGRDLKDSLERLLGKASEQSRTACTGRR